MSDRSFRTLAVAFVLAALVAAPAAAQNTILVDENFDGGSLPATWTHYPGNVCSDVQFLNVGMSGLSMVLATNTDGCYAATGVMTELVDVSSCSDIRISTSMMTLGEDEHGCPAFWNAASPPSGDCLGYTDDGVTVFHIDDIVGLNPNQEYSEYGDLPNPGISQLALYFLEYDNYTPVTEGLAFDDIVIICDPEEIDCTNGVDDDYDGDTDCSDPDCAADPACVGMEGACDDGVDNDGDGLVDCDDPDCFGDPACPFETLCDDEQDDDEDGCDDCYDYDCLADPACSGQG